MVATPYYYDLKSGAISWNLWLYDNINKADKNWAEISSISHPNGSILVGLLRVSDAECLRVGKSLGCGTHFDQMLQAKYLIII